MRTPRLFSRPFARFAVVVLTVALCSVPLTPTRAQSGAKLDSAASPARASISQDASGFPRRGNTPEAIQAREAQDAFERTHRQGLRFYNGGADATCEEQIGRLCYWNNNGDVPPPAERSDARIERLQLIEALEIALKADASDDWVVGMLVRYDIESDRPDSALKAARRCKGTPWWCESLEGLALHTLNQHVAARAAFDRALGQMPVDQKCAWLDLSLWFEQDKSAIAAYKAKPCTQRLADDQRLLRLAQPLWMLPANDLYNELLARHTITKVHSLGRIPYDLGYGEDILESQMRYGWPTNWSVQNGGVADSRPPTVIGHEPTPSYDFMPSSKALAAPTTATSADWSPNRAKARMRYSPRYAGGFMVPPHQFARFRRGDSTVVAGAYRLVRDLEMGRAPYNAGFVLDALNGTPPTVVRRDSAPANLAMLAPLGKSPMLASLEVVAPIGRRAARARESVSPLPAGAKISDILVLTKGDATGTPSLESASQQAYGATEIDNGATIGLYWETYFPPTPGTPTQVSIRALKVDASFLQKLGGALKLSKAVQPVSIRYSDPGRPDGLPGRSLSVKWPAVSSGSYRMTLIMRGPSGTDSTSSIITVRSAK